MNLLIASLLGLMLSSSPSGARQQVTAIVQKIKHADYEGDRAALKRLHEELSPYVADSEIGARVLYWRGFSLWRRSLNGFNDGADPKELEDDLGQCVVDFKQAWARDPGLVDAKGGAASCMVNHSFLIMSSDRVRARELFQESTTLLNEALAEAPDNPRLLWVKGANQFYGRESGAQERAIATYERGVALARKQKTGTADALDVTWGEPELLMNLAFANLHKTSPDLSAAKGYAESALALVPYWHYVRDILIVQIQKAKGAAASPVNASPSAREASIQGFVSVRGIVQHIRVSPERTVW